MTTEQALTNIIHSFIFKKGLIESEWSEMSEEYLYKSFSLIDWKINNDMQQDMYCCKVSIGGDVKSVYIPVSDFNKYIRDAKINEIL